MNAELQAYARQQILEGLQQLPEAWQLTFKRMYSHLDLDKSLENVVADMPADKLDWAMQQVVNSLAKLEKQNG